MEQVLNRAGKDEDDVAIETCSLFTRKTRKLRVRARLFILSVKIQAYRHEYETF